MHFRTEAEVGSELQRKGSLHVRGKKGIWEPELQGSSARKLLLRRYGPSAVAVLVVLTIVGYPLASLLRASLLRHGHLDFNSYSEILSGSTIVAVMHTLLVSIGATLLAVLVGAAMALLITRTNIPGRLIFGFAWSVPLLIPAYVTGLAWIGAYAQGGLTSEWLGIRLGMLSSPWGLVVLLAVEGYPIAYLLIASGLLGQRIAEMEEAARSSGASPWRTLRDVTFPLLRPVILMSMLVVFVGAASDFGIPAVVGVPAGYSVITTTIYSELSFNGGQYAIGDATALATLLGLIGLFAVVLVMRLSRSQLSVGGNRGVSTNAPMIQLGSTRWPIAMVGSAIVVFVIMLPLTALLLESLSRNFTLSIFPSNWTLSHLKTAISGADLLSLGRSVFLAMSAAAVVAIGGGLFALLAQRRTRLTNALEVLTALPFALPGSIIAVGALVAWDRWFYGTLIIIWITYLSRFAVFGVRAGVAALNGVPSELVLAARVGGARLPRAINDIVRPLVSSQVLAGAALVFLLAVHELTISSLLCVPGTNTFAVQVLSAEESGNLALTASLAIVVTIVVALAALPILFSSSARRLLRGGI